jgi:glyoxylase-like metal-dependent hydrolase (beta-lactamase superfamily II)
MINVKCLTFNAFQENTYVISDDETNECLIIDPGCSNSHEENILSEYLERENLHPVGLINTHCHIDHVLGNQFVADTYGLTLASHRGEEAVLASCDSVSRMYGIPFKGSPSITRFIDEGDKLKLGSCELVAFFTPGHSPASLSFYESNSGTLIAGDVLFQGSIGRTDLPGGDFNTLIESIKTKFLTLPDDTTVYPGHGPKTTIGIERRTNPFLVG